MGSPLLPLVRRATRMAAIPAVLLVTSCSSADQVDLDGELPPLHTKKPVPAPSVVVRDSFGRVMDEPPAVTLSVEPASLARVEDGQIVPLANGSGTLLASVEGVDRPARRPLQVKLVDGVDVLCRPSSCAVALGERLQVSAFPMSGGEAVAGVPVQWSLDDKGVFDVLSPGELVARAPGQTRVVATAGDVSGARDVKVWGDPDRLLLACGDVEVTGTAERDARKKPTRACEVHVGERIQLQLVAFAGDERVPPPRATWSVSNREVADVDDGAFTARAEGGVVVSVAVGLLSAEMPVLMTAAPPPPPPEPEPEVTDGGVAAAEAASAAADE